MSFGATTEMDERILQFCAWLYSKVNLDAIARILEFSNNYNVFRRGIVGYIFRLSIFG